MRLLLFYLCVQFFLRFITCPFGGLSLQSSMPEGKQAWSSLVGDALWKKKKCSKFWHNVQWCSHVLTQKKCSWLFMKVGLRGQFVHLECAFEFYLSDSCLCSISLCSRGIHLSHCILWNTEQVHPPRASLSHRNTCSNIAAAGHCHSIGNTSSSGCVAKDMSADVRWTVGLFTNMAVLLHLDADAWVMTFRNNCVSCLQLLLLLLFLLCLVSLWYISDCEGWRLSWSLVHRAVHAHFVVHV